MDEDGPYSARKTAGRLIMSDKKSLAVVAGAGSGLGRALLKRFQDGGYEVVGLGRSPLNDSDFPFQQVDLSNENDASQTLGALIADRGAPKVVIHNTAELVIAPFEKTTPADYQRTWNAMVLTAILLAKATVPPMVESGGGAFLVSGATASLRGGARFSAFASAKFALRGLAQSLAREYQSEGVHVAHMILDGIIDTPRSRDLHTLDPDRMMKPADIAEIYWQVAHQPASTWTHELDLRPQTERF